MAQSCPAPRDLRHIGVGSCGISNYDAIPLTRRLMAFSPTACTRLLDLGCGNGRYLVYFCLALADLENAWGIEPSAKSCEDARKLVTHHGLDDRVSIIHGTAASALKVDNELSHNFAVIGFVLREILGQAGRQVIVDIIKGLVGSFPELSLVVIEVDGELADIKYMSVGIKLAYYNPYSTLHPFNLQILESSLFWEAVFHDAGHKILSCLTTDTKVDSTGLEIGFFCAELTNRD